MTPAEQKAQMRRAAIERRDSHPISIADAEAVIPYFLKSFGAPGRIVALYKSRGREFDTGPLIAALQDHGMICALPVVGEGRILRFARFMPGDDLTPGPHGILQPIESAGTDWLDPDIVAVPMLACDEAGNRIGYGGGYYDATLADLRQKKNIVAAGLCHTAQLLDIPIPAEPHDEKLDCVITPDGVHTFGHLRLAR